MFATEASALLTEAGMDVTDDELAGQFPAGHFAWHSIAPAADAVQERAARAPVNA